MAFTNTKKHRTIQPKKQCCLIIICSLPVPLQLSLGIFKNKKDPQFSGTGSPKEPWLSKRVGTLSRYCFLIIKPRNVEVANLSSPILSKQSTTLLKDRCLSSPNAARPSSAIRRSWEDRKSYLISWRLSFVWIKTPSPALFFLIVPWAFISHSNSNS